MALTTGFTGATDEQIRQMYEHAKALREHRKQESPFYTWANGLDDVTRALMGKREFDKTAALDLASHRQMGEPGPEPVDPVLSIHHLIRRKTIFQRPQDRRSGPERT